MWAPPAGRQEPSDPEIQLRRKAAATPQTRYGGRKQGSPADRRAFASSGGRRQGKGARRATDNSAWESRKAPTRLSNSALPLGTARSVAGFAPTNRAFDTLALVPHDPRGFSPPVAADYRRPATPARTIQAPRPDRPRRGRLPRRIAAGQRLSTRHSRPGAFVPEARRDAPILRLPIPTDPTTRNPEPPNDRIPQSPDAERRAADRHSIRSQRGSTGPTVKRSRPGPIRFQLAIGASVDVTDARKSLLGGALLGQ